MRKLLNTLYVTTPDAYLALDGDNIVIKKDDAVAMRLPFLNVEGIVCFNYLGASPALMGACADHSVDLCFLSPHGRFLARIIGRVKGNVLLRKTQYQLSELHTKSVPIAKSFLLGKIANCRKVLERALRDHALLLDDKTMSQVSASLRENLRAVNSCEKIDDLMGFEGSSAKLYFSVFDQLILQQKTEFYFKERNRRPPLDNVNALLSFAYTLLTSECSSALETVGLDPYVGFLHQDRPGRPSLALDLMEELRPVLADRFVLSLVNLRQVAGSGFTLKENGGVLMDDATRKKVLAAWQERKKEEIIHPFLKERIPIGLIPYVQALLLARHLRGDLDAYPPYFWN